MNGLNKMGHRSAGVFGLVGLVALLCAAPPASAQPHAQADVSACFVPEERCTGEITAVLDAAQTEIRVQAYAFSSRLIAAALKGQGQQIAHPAPGATGERSGEWLGTYPAVPEECRSPSS